jgi:hypothetical protein
MIKVKIENPCSIQAFRHQQALPEPPFLCAYKRRNWNCSILELVLTTSLHTMHQLLNQQTVSVSVAAISTVEIINASAKGNFSPSK